MAVLSVDEDDGSGSWYAGQRGHEIGQTVVSGELVETHVLERCLGRCQGDPVQGAS